MLRHVRHVDAIFAECDIVGCALSDRHLQNGNFLTALNRPMEEQM